MSMLLRRVVGIAVLVTATVSAAGAQTLADSNAEARIAWAKRRVELVCRPLQAQGRKAEAAKCFQSVSLFIADPESPMPNIGPIPVHRLAEPAASPNPVQPSHRPVAKATKSAPATRVALAPKPRHTPIRHRVARATAATPARRMVVASADQDAMPVVGVRDPAPTVRRCGSLPCARFMTILGVGY